MNLLRVKFQTLHRNSTCLRIETTSMLKMTHFLLNCDIVLCNNYWYQHCITRTRLHGLYGTKTYGCVDAPNEMTTCIQVLQHMNYFVLFGVQLLFTRWVRVCLKSIRLLYWYEFHLRLILGTNIYSTCTEE